MKLSELQNYSIIGSGNILQPYKKTQTKSVSQRVLDAGTSVANFFGAKGISEQFGADLARSQAKTQKAKDSIQYPEFRNVVGSAIQTGANLLPGAASGAGLATKAVIGGATGYAFDVGSKLQGNNSVTDSFKPGVATGVGAALPLAGTVIKPAAKIVGRILKGLGSGLSGVSTKNIDAILTEPSVAKGISEQITKNGGSQVLEKETKTILSGVSKIKQEARSAFGEGLSQLSATDIEPKVFRSEIQNTLDKYGISKTDGKRLLSNVEFNDPKNIQKASELVDRLSKVNLDGKSLRKLSDDIVNSAYKIATSDERLSFNAFIRELADTLKNTIKKTTPKLAEIDAKFSQDMQLAQATEQIFGKVKFGNLQEIVKASQKLENLFAQKGLAPDVVDSFLTRIGVSPEGFKAGEAVRQITDKVTGANTKGLTFAELTQQITSSVITPQTIRDLTIKTGLAREKLVPFLKGLKSMKPAMQKALLNALVSEETR